MNHHRHTSAAPPTPMQSYLSQQKDKMSPHMNEMSMNQVTEPALDDRSMGIPKEIIIHDHESPEISEGANSGEEEESPTAALEEDIKELRKVTTSDAAGRLEGYLNNMKQATEKMLGEIDVYLKETETIAIDYVRCQHSQENESRRLEDCEPGVQDATSKFLQQVTMPFASLQQGDGIY